MLAFFILFSLVGFALGYLFGDKSKESIAFIIIGLTTFIWFFVAGPWAFATLAELLLGYNIALKFVKK